MIRTASFGILPLQPSSCKLLRLPCRTFFFLFLVVYFFFLLFFPPSAEFFIDDSGQTTRVSARSGPGKSTGAVERFQPIYLVVLQRPGCAELSTVSAICIIYKRDRCNSSRRDLLLKTIHGLSVYAREQAENCIMTFEKGEGKKKQKEGETVRGVVCEFEALIFYFFFWNDHLLCVPRVVSLCGEKKS